MRNVTDLMPPGTAPARFVAVVVPSISESMVWNIDESPAMRPTGLAYLAHVRSALGDLGPLDMTLTRRLVAYAGQDEPKANLVYLAVFALTELNGGRSVVVELSDGEVAIRPMDAADHAGALAELDRLLLDAPPAPGMH